MTRIEQLVADIRAERLRRGLTKYELAKLARLHPNSLRHLDETTGPLAWHPLFGTLRALEEALWGDEAPQPCSSTTPAP